MNFSNFQLRRTCLLNERPGLLDAAETNLYRALAPLMPGPAKPVDGTVHRCHLASQWVSFYGLPPEVSRRAFVSCGVRDSLRTLFHHLAQSPCILWLPEDNYPVYHELAATAGLTPRVFPTLPEIDWPKDEPDMAAGPEWLLVTHPVKPRGRSLGAADIIRLKQWLSASPLRRVVLDSVYMLEPRFDAATHELLMTGQAVLLHSLTKGWLHPRCFGIALMPAQDVDEWMPVFRARPPAQENLATARHLMTSHADLPLKIAESLRGAQNRLREAIQHLQVAPLPVDATSYLVPVMRSWDELLALGILGLPASVFGSHRDDLTILSSLQLVS